MHADIPGSDVGIVVDKGHVFQWHAKFFSDDQGDHGVDALTDFGGAGNDRHPSVIVHLQDGANTVGLVNLGAARVVDRRGQADALLVAPWLVPLRRERLALGAVVTGFGRRLQTFHQRAFAQERFLRRDFAR